MLTQSKIVAKIWYLYTHKHTSIPSGTLIACIVTHYYEQFRHITLKCRILNSPCCCCRCLFSRLSQPSSIDDKAWVSVAEHNLLIARTNLSALFVHISVHMFPFSESIMASDDKAIANTLYHVVWTSMAWLGWWKKVVRKYSAVDKNVKLI